MSYMRKKMALTGLLSALLVASPASWALTQVFFGEDLGNGETLAPITTYTNATASRNQFLSHLTGVGTEDFEAPDQTAGQVAPLVLSFPGAGTATLTGGGSISAVPLGQTNGFGRFATSGTQYWEGTTTFGISFSQPIVAFGFYGIDIGDFAGQVTVTTSNGAVTPFTLNNTINGPGGSVLFWGLIDTAHPFTAITFGNTNAGTDFFGFDDMTIGTVAQVVPEPGSVALLGLGLAGLAVVRQRRKVS